MFKRNLLSASIANTCVALFLSSVKILRHNHRPISAAATCTAPLTQHRLHWPMMVLFGSQARGTMILLGFAFLHIVWVHGARIRHLRREALCAVHCQCLVTNIGVRGRCPSVYIPEKCAWRMVHQHHYKQESTSQKRVHNNFTIKLTK